MQDPVSDMLTRIRNAQMIGIKEVRMPHSKFNLAILNVMQEEGYIAKVSTIAEGSKKDLHITLKYHQDQPVIEVIKRVSKPALRVYKSCDELPMVRGGLGIAVISTPKGVMSDRNARANRVGGEVLCTVE